MGEAMKKNSKNGESKKRLIYVVDDEPMLLELATVILEPLGYSVKTFRNPGLAVEEFLAEKPKPVLIITDYAMHLMTGIDLITACRKASPRQRVLMVSGTITEDHFRNSPVKPDRALPTPYPAKQLTDMVELLIHR